MVHIKYSLRALLVILIVLTAINLMLLLAGKREKTLVDKHVVFLDSKNRTREFEMPADDEIGLNLKIHDISRIDISCEYIVRDLAQKIPKKYRNQKRYCSLASLRGGLDTTLSKSVRSDHKDE